MTPLSHYDRLSLFSCAHASPRRQPFVPLSLERPCPNPTTRSKCTSPTVPCAPSPPAPPRTTSPCPSRPASPPPRLLPAFVPCSRQQARPRSHPPPQAHPRMTKSPYPASRPCTPHPMQPPSAWSTSAPPLTEDVHLQLLTEKDADAIPLSATPPRMLWPPPCSSSFQRPSSATVPHRRRLLLRLLSPHAFHAR